MARTIAVIGTGDMGSAVGAALVRRGYRVVTDSTGRSEHSRALAARAGIENVGSLEAVVAAADMILSILPPAAAPAFADRVAAVIGETATRPRGKSLSTSPSSSLSDCLFVDCNAVSPDTLHGMARSFAAVGAPFLDVGIVGPAPRPQAPRPTRFYVSGADRSALLELDVPELRVIDMGPEPGRASAIKMCYAGLNKGVDALYTAILLAAERLDVRPELMAELEASQSEAARRMASRIPFLAATAERYTGEMREIAATFAAADVTPDFHHGAAWLYALLARTPLAEETRASLPPQRSLDDALDVFAAALSDELAANLHNVETKS